MKNSVYRLVISFTLLSSLVGIFGLVSLQQAHAASIQEHQSTSQIVPMRGIFRTDCNEGGYFELRNDTGTLCFANAGALPVTIYHVYNICSGNNAGFVLDDRGGQPHFAKFECRNFDNMTVTLIRIY